MKKAVPFSVEKVYTTKKDLLLYLNLLDTNPIIQRFLNYDKYYCLADKYLIAMVFIYFKRAQLSPREYTYFNFFAGLCLAQSMEEDIDLSSEIYPWALGKNYVQTKLPSLLELKSLLWQAMDHRAAVSHHCCTQLISISQDHYVWQRERSSSYFESYISNAIRYVLQGSDQKRVNSSTRKCDKSHNCKC